MNTLPFGVHSLAPELVKIPKMRTMQLKDEAPATLRLTEDSRNALNMHIETIGLERQKYEYTVKGQQKALEDYAKLYLYLPVREERDAQSKLAIQTTTSKPIGGKTKELAPWKRYTRIFQCQCGVDNASGHHASEKRQMPWKNVGCLFWVKLVTTHVNSEGIPFKQVKLTYTDAYTYFLIDARLLAVDEISGMLDHSDLCDLQNEMERNPRLPLNAELREFALGLLRKTAPLSLLRSECLAWAEKKWPESVGDSYSRFRLTAHDMSSLYRSISRENGIPQRSAAENNLDLWFRAVHPIPPTPLLTTACLHYQAHREPETDRFEIILSTPEMQQAAWKYGHKKQVLMDLTFGVCSARALLLILMAIDETGAGVPIAFIMFTARSHAKAVHADYDTRVIDRLLSIFKKALGTNNSGEAFEICVGNTDNDARERAALTANWPDIQLLLCIFHVWQSWKNALNRHLSCVPKGDERKAVRKRLGSLLACLMKDITTHEDALSAYQCEVLFWESMARKRNRSSKIQAKGALKFLAYLSDYTHNKPFWMAWSPAGALEAAQRLGISLESVARTTNHLESFNGRIKGKYLKPYHHSGRLPRIDTWILVIVKSVMPDFFKERTTRMQISDHYASLRRLKPQLVPNNLCSSDASDPQTGLSLICEDGLISTWLEDLDNEEEMEPEDEDEVEEEIVCGVEEEKDKLDEEESEVGDEEDKVDEEENAEEGTPAGTDSSLDFVPTSMSYDESSCHPHPLQLFLQYRAQNSSPGSSVIEDSQDCENILKSLDVENPQSPALRYRPLINLPQDASQELTDEELNTIASKMIEITQAQDVMVNSMQTILRISPSLRSQLNPFISNSIRMQLDTPDTDSSGLDVSESTSGSEDQQEPNHSVPHGQLVPFVPAKKEARKPSYKIH